METACFARKPSCIGSDESLQVGLLGKYVYTLYGVLLVFIQLKIPDVPSCSVSIITIDVFPRPIEQPKGVLVGGDRQQTCLAIDLFAG